jgi:hypothetical protein
LYEQIGLQGNHQKNAPIKALLCLSSTELFSP